MNWFRVVAVWMFLFGATANAGPALVAESAAHQQMLGLAEQLRCAVCQNQSVAESNSGLAQDMRLVISEQLAAGQTEQQVLDYFVARYGGYILMKPQGGGRNAMLWWFPVVFLPLVLFIVYRNLRTSGRHIAPPTELSDSERAAVARARAEADE